MLADDIEVKRAPYLLLTPGPLSTSPTVKSAMWYDSCTWDADYKNIVTSIRQELLKIARCDPATYTTVLMQGSGTFGVESVLGSSIDIQHQCVLILQNGVYGKRMVEMAEILGLPHEVYEVAENETFDPVMLQHFLENNPAISHIAMVHCETTTGLLNDIQSVSRLAHQFHKYFIVDAMSSFGGMDINITDLNIDFLISSANKCIQGVPGFSFVICKTKSLIELCHNQAKSLSLDLYGQWKEMEKDKGKWRYTSPTHVVLAFKQALAELAAEGGIAVRAKRYRDNQKILARGMADLGFHSYIAPELQSSIITTYLEPEFVPNTKRKFVFNEFYHYLKQHGFVIYPGKVTNKNSFRIGTIGHLFPDDVVRFLGHVNDYVNLR